MFCRCGQPIDIAAQESMNGLRVRQRVHSHNFEFQLTEFELASSAVDTDQIIRYHLQRGREELAAHCPVSVMPVSTNYGSYLTGVYSTAFPMSYSGSMFTYSVPVPTFAAQPPTPAPKWQAPPVAAATRPNTFGVPIARKIIK